jgi:hypothetical protein
VTMQVFVGDPDAMIAAAVQCDVDGIPKGSHYVLLKRANGSRYRRLEGRDSFPKRINPKPQKGNLAVRIQPSACTPC